MNSTQLFGVVQTDEQGKFLAPIQLFRTNREAENFMNESHYKEVSRLQGLYENVKWECGFSKCIVHYGFGGHFKEWTIVLANYED